MRTLLATTVLTLSLAACSSPEGKKSETTQPKDESAAPATPKDEVKPAGGSAGEPRVKVVDGAAPSDDDRYELKIETPEAESGKESKVTVRVVPKEPWHMNLDFPTSLKLEAPETVALTKPALDKADAQLDEKACQFDVVFTPSAAGEQTFTGKFKFAVCQDEACSPVTEDLEFKVAVK